jgi:DNA mismatch endonuclease (patch repair protein)
MIDVMSVETRSALMSRIRSKDTTPEMLVRRYLWADGFRYRLHSSHLPGRPDLLLPRWHATVFVHGCFWHRHDGCSRFRLPKTHRGFWDAKLRRNSERDAANAGALAGMGWRVAVVWECALRQDAAKTERLLATWLKGNGKRAQILCRGDAVQRVALAVAAVPVHAPSRLTRGTTAPVR